MDMKRILLVILLALIIPLTMAQHHPNNRPHVHSSSPVKKCTVIFTAENNELFWVNINGRIINKKAQNIVKIHNLPNQLCDVQIVLKHPANERVNLKIVPQIKMDRYVVSYDERTRALKVIPMYESHHHPHQGPQPPTHVVPAVPPVAPPAPMVCSSDEVNEMCKTIKREGFDDNRIEMAKLIVKSKGKLFKASHIKKMANCLTFDSSKLKFLKFAFTYCVDPNNYYECVNALTFSSDKKKLMEFINSTLK